MSDEYIVWQPGELPEWLRDMEKPMKELSLLIADKLWGVNGSSGAYWETCSYRMKREDYERLCQTGDLYKVQLYKLKKWHEDISESLSKLKKSVQKIEDDNFRFRQALRSIVNYVDMEEVKVAKLPIIREIAMKALEEK